MTAKVKLTGRPASRLPGFGVNVTVFGLSRKNQLPSAGTATPSILTLASSARLLDSNLLIGKVIGVSMLCPDSFSSKVPLLVFPVTLQLCIVCSEPKPGALTTLAGLRLLFIVQVNVTGKPANGLSDLGLSVTIWA
ncbi:hypothetical protein D3C87_1492530 [compost metagenome]